MHRINCYREKQKNVQNCKQTLAVAAILIHAIPSSDQEIHSMICYQTLLTKHISTAAYTCTLK